jgi:uncharacterized protein
MSSEIRTHKTITDPVHGSIQLTKLETDLVDTMAFQRLRNVKQLGLAHYVFPSADHSRFVHSLGTCAVMSRILLHLHEHFPTAMQDQRPSQFYRAAALLHDIGHYPFSHTFETVIADYYSPIQAPGESCPGADGEPEEPTTLNMSLEGMSHEAAGRTVILHDEQVSKLLKDFGLDPEELAAYINSGLDDDSLLSLMTSDLDADRIDYLLRSAHQAGLPFGSVDIDYLIHQMRLVPSGEVAGIGLSSRALRSADHFLISRYFDYHQVAFHKTVAAFEELLSSVLKRLLELEMITAHKDSIQSMIENRSWRHFNDSAVTSAIRKLASKDDEDHAIQFQAQSIVERRPPRLIWDWGEFGNREVHRTLRQHRRWVDEKLGDLAKAIGVDERLLFVWENDGKRMTSLASWQQVGDSPGEDKVRAAVRMIDDDGSAGLLIRNPRSMMSVLSNYTTYELRVYALLDDEQAEANRESIRNNARELFESD